jgi:sRNA-binding regulator protein Hfq
VTTPLAINADTPLIELAKKKFGKLTRGEEKLFADAVNGEFRFDLGENDEENDPVDAGKWDAQRVLRADCIAWLCTDPQASTLVTHRGIRIRGMRVEGDLELEDAQFPFPLNASKCVFKGTIFLRAARFQALYLEATYVQRLSADRVEIASGVFLRNGFKAEGEVKFVGATIGGTLDCAGAQLSNPLGSALSADGVKIESSVFLRNGFKGRR